MIVSHKHRFIFMKSAKAGGTSIEIALRALCGEDDVVTPLTEDDAGLAGCRAQNFLFPMMEWPEPDRAKWLRGEKPNLHNPHRLGFYSHMPAARAWVLLGNAVWTSYFKFSVERNPWDRQVSYYHWRLRDGPASPESFAAFTRENSLDNWKFYTIDDKVAVDHVIRYDRDLLPGLNAALRHVGLTVPALPNAKSSGRSNGPDDYRRYYDDALRDIVRMRHRREISHFGWTF